MEKKTVYVVTHCAAEENYTPSVFTNKTDALKEVARIYNELMVYSDCVDEAGFWEDGFEIVWQDYTYDKVKIFEVNIQ